MKCPNCKSDLEFVTTVDTEESAWLCNKCEYLKEVEDTDKHEEYDAQVEDGEESQALNEESISLGGFE